MEEKYLFRLALVFLVLFHITSQLQAQWKTMNQGIGSSLDFVSDNVGWCLDAEGRLYKTTDGGNTWERIVTDQERVFTDIDFVSENIGWSIFEKTILKTINGGKSWIEQIKTTFDFEYISVVNKNVAFAASRVVANNGKQILKTTNGGSRWFDVSPNLEKLQIHSISFLDENTGIVGCGFPNHTNLILKTLNGGSTWGKIVVPNIKNKQIT